MSNDPWLSISFFFPKWKLMSVNVGSSSCFVYTVKYVISKAPSMQWRDVKSGWSFCRLRSQKSRQASWWPSQLQIRHVLFYVWNASWISLPNTPFLFFSPMFNGGFHCQTTPQKETFHHFNVNTGEKRIRLLCLVSWQTRSTWISFTLSLFLGAPVFASSGHKGRTPCAEEKSENLIFERMHFENDLCRKTINF